MLNLPLFMSTIALFLYSFSYFFNQKKKYLILQLSGNFFLSISYLLIGSYFTMVAVAIGIARGFICYLYEKKNRKVPLVWIVGLCLASILSYIIINIVILSQASTWDFLYLFASCMYVISFAIRHSAMLMYFAIISPSPA